MIKQHYDAPSAGHLGYNKTVSRIHQVGLVGLLQDIDKDCRECAICQCNKPTTPVKAPLTNVPIGKLLQIIAVDILEVPTSKHNNCYLLVLMITRPSGLVPFPFQTKLHVAQLTR